MATRLAPSPDAEVTRANAGKWIRLGIGVAIGLSMLYAIASSAGGVDDTVRALREADLGLVLAAAACEVASYVMLGLLLRRLTGRPTPLSRRTAVRLGLVVAGLGYVLPAAPAEGLTLAAAELRRRDVPPRRVALALGLSQWYTTRAVFALVSFAALVLVLLAEIRFPGRHPLRMLGALAILVLAFLALITWVGTRRRTAELVALVGGRAMFWRPARPAAQLRATGASWHEEATRVLGSRGDRVGIGTLAVLCGLGDALCFAFSLAAAGVRPRPVVFLLAYGAAMLTVFVPLVPAGLGVVESMVPALLQRTRVPLATSLAGVLVYRGLATLLPAVAGTVALLMLRLGPVKETGATSSAPDGSAPADPLPSLRDPAAG